MLPHQNCGPAHRGLLIPLSYLRSHNSFARADIYSLHSPCRITALDYRINVALPSINISVADQILCNVKEVSLKDKSSLLPAEKKISFCKVPVLNLEGDLPKQLPSHSSKNLGNRNVIWLVTKSYGYKDIYIDTAFLAKDNFAHCISALSVSHGK